MVGQAQAEALQLVFAYQPKPPFNSGAPEQANPEVLAQINGMLVAQKGGLVDYTAQKRV